MRDLFGVEAKTIEIQGKKHVVELQSIRGLASLAVVIHHCSFYFLYNPVLKHANEIIVNAHAAVVCFFVLSGFVLRLSWGGAALTAKNLITFYFRRAFRIYPALWASCILALCYVFLYNGVPLPSIVDPWWPAGSRLINFVARDVLTTVLGIQTPLSIPMWTLQIELGGSLILPYLAYSVSQARVLFWIITIGLLALALWPGYLKLEQARLGLMQFFVHFAFGVIVAEAATKARIGRPKAFYYSLATAGFVVMWFGRTMFHARFSQDYNAPIPSVLEGLGASALIYAIYCGTDAFLWLRRQSLVWLGDISYSLYLVHLPILGIIAAVGAENLRLPLFRDGGIPGTLALTFSTLLMSALVSAFLYRFLEVPSIEFGKQVLVRLRLKPADNADLVRHV